MESERITKANIIQAYISAQDKGLHEDLRERIYREVKRMTFDDLLNFHQLYIKNLPQSVALIGNRENINFDDLAHYGEVIELDLKDLFDY